MKKTITQQKTNEKGIIDVIESKIKLYKKQILAFVIIVILIAIGSALVSHFKNKAYQKEWSELFIAELPIAMQQEGEDLDLSKLEIYVAANENTPAGAYGALTLGNAYYQMKDYDKAEVYFKQAIKNGSDDLKAIAESSLVADFLAAQRYDKAIEQANAFEAKYPNHFAIAQVKTHKALATELSGKKQEAKEMYTAIIEQYPSSYSSALAELQSSKMK